MRKSGRSTRATLKSSEQSLPPGTNRSKKRAAARRTDEPRKRPRDESYERNVEEQNDSEDEESNLEEDAQLDLPLGRNVLPITMSGPKVLRLKHAQASSASRTSSASRRSNLSQLFSHDDATSRNSSLGEFPFPRSSPPSGTYGGKAADITPEPLPLEDTTQRRQDRYRQSTQSQTRHKQSHRRLSSSGSDLENPRPMLWQGVRRRQKRQSSEGHIEMLKACRGLMAALVLSGEGTKESEGGRRTDVWCNANNEYTQNLILQVWHEVRRERKKYHIPLELRIMPEPLSHEARELKDYISDYRSKVMQRAREEVQQFFPTDDHAATQEKVERLLDQDRFMCGDGGEGSNEPDVKDRWMGQSIIRLIARVFWVKADSGLARVSATAAYFTPLRGETIYYIVSCLNWGLREYESGARRTHRCDAGLEACYQRFRNAWQQQNKTKRDLVCAILTGRVASYVRRLDGEIDDHEDEEDPHRDDITTLMGYQQFLTPQLRATMYQASSSPTMTRSSPDSLFNPPVLRNMNDHSVKEVPPDPLNSGSGDTDAEGQLTVHWYVAGKLQYQILLRWNSDLHEVIDTLVEEGLTEVSDMVRTNTLMLWFWKTENGDSNATVVSEKQDFEDLLSQARKDGLTILYGKAHTREDEQSPPP